ncbi:MAG: M15 family metallopeptidase [Gammaproteobacteria bacterium]|nr:M15 family metallopeptidase [Gammaproteobacteria bacterium]
MTEQTTHTELRRRVRDTLRRLGASTDLLDHRRLPVYADASKLEIADVSASGREHLLVPKAATSWKRMREAAKADGISLIIISAFRSFDRQYKLVSDKLNRGETIQEVFAVMAPPGCSEHHTGRALDVGTLGYEPVSEEFAESAAFHWLTGNAARFGFRLSFPRDNLWGFDYEPWHWCYHGRSTYAER